MGFFMQISKLFFSFWRQFSPNNIESPVYYITSPRKHVVLILHSRMLVADLSRVYAKPPDGYRKIVSSNFFVHEASCIVFRMNLFDNCYSITDRMSVS